MWEDFSGKPFDQLFDSSNEDATFLFMLVDPELQISSQTPIGEGYIIYLGFISNTSSTKEMKPAGSETYMKILDGEIPCTGVGGTHDVGTIFTTGSLKFDQVKKILGHDEGERHLVNYDKRLVESGSVMCHYTDENGVSWILRLSSIAAQWRIAMYNNSANRLHQFYTMYTMLNNQKPKDPTHPVGTPHDKVFASNSEDVVYSTDQLLPMICCPTEEQFKILTANFEAIRSNGKTFGEKQHADMDIMQELMKVAIATKDDKRHSLDKQLANLVMCFLFSSPFEHRLEASKYYSHLVDGRNKVINTIVSKEGGVDRFKLFTDNIETLGNVDPVFVKHKDGAPTDTHSKAANHVKRLVSSVVSYTERNHKGDDATKEMAMKRNLRTLVYKERGDSLYTLVKAFNAIDEETSILKPSTIPNVKVVKFDKTFPKLHGSSGGAAKVFPKSKVVTWGPDSK
jgi:hypothetical protein